MHFRTLNSFIPASSFPPLVMVSPYLTFKLMVGVHLTLADSSFSAGKDILSNESYKKRIVLESGFDLPSLEAYSDTVKFFGFNQFFVYPDAPHMVRKLIMNT